MTDIEAFVAYTRLTDALSEYTAVEFAPALLSNLQAQMRLAAPGDVTSKVQFALNAIAGAGVDAQNYTQLMPIFRRSY